MIKTTPITVPRPDVFQYVSVGMGAQILRQKFLEQDL